MKSPADCQFGHGTVYADPYPGYVHGRNAGVCPNGCLPQLTAQLTKNETKLQTLEREAVEYLKLFYAENRDSYPETALQQRLDQVLVDIQTRKTYDLTFEELEYGCQVAWRNAPKCANRKFWSSLRLIDKRLVDSVDGMFEACLEHIHLAGQARASEAFITVFKPQNFEGYGPVVFNTQLIRYAGHRQPGGNIKGDPAEVTMTDYVKDQFGWQPKGSKESQFDVLPLVLQYSNEEKPKMFEIPRRLILEVPLDGHPQLKDMGLRWYGIPMVSNVGLDIGGLKFSACPFNGWYSVTEIVRNLTDECRYNILPAVAATMGLDMSTPIWRDVAQCAITQLVFHSFKKARVAMVDHHSLMTDFYSWYQSEMKERGFCPGNWKWIIPPIASNLSPSYLQLNKMTEYTLKPCYLRFPIPTMVEWLASRKSKATINKMDTKILVLYGSVTGTAEGYAKLVFEALKQCNASTKLMSMDSFNGDRAMDGIDVLLVISSTYGAGRPPPSARKFISYLTAKDSKQSAGSVNVAIFGLGSHNFPKFCGSVDVFEKLVSSRFGPKAMLVKSVKSDVEVDTADNLLQWTWQVANQLGFDRSQIDLIDQKLRESLAKGLQPFKIKLLTEPPPPASRVVLLDHEQFAQATAIDRLGPDCVLIKLKMLSGSIWQYEPGDHLEVFSPNILAPSANATYDLLNQYCRNFTGFTNLEQVVDVLRENATKSMPFPAPNSLFKLLTEYLALNELISRRGLSLLRKLVPSNACLTELAAHDDEEVSFWLKAKQATWLKMFEAIPGLKGQLNLTDFLAILPTLKARRYSISSSNLVNPEEIHLTVALHRFEVNILAKADNSKQSKVKDAKTIICGSAQISPANLKLVELKGACSLYLNEYLKPKMLLRCQVRQNPGFYLPHNASTPLVFIATGSGIAPMRGFWQQRLHILEHEGAKLGPAVLFYGCHDDAEFLFKSEIQDALKRGILSRNVVAFSRVKNQPKIYVQNLIEKLFNDDTEIRQVLQHAKSHFYVCGGSTMAKDVMQVLTKCLGSDTMASIADEERYHEDVFASNKVGN